MVTAIKQECLLKLCFQLHNMNSVVRLFQVTGAA